MGGFLYLVAVLIGEEKSMGHAIAFSIICVLVLYPSFSQIYLELILSQIIFFCFSVHVSIFFLPHFTSPFLFSGHHILTLSSVSTHYFLPPVFSWVHRMLA